MNETSIKCKNICKIELEKFNQLKVERFYVSNSGSFILNCQKQYAIKSESYTFIDTDGIEYDTSLSVKLHQDEITLLNDCKWELTPEIQKEYDLLKDKQYAEVEKNELVANKLRNLLENDISNLTIEKIEYYDVDTFLLTFIEIENFHIKLYTTARYGYGISIETYLYTILVSNEECKISCEKVEKDYKSFSSAAKSRFRTMAKELGYEQITGIVYVKEREGWYETFNLQLSSGNPFFYINYGVILPNTFPMRIEQLRDSGWNLGGRLGNGFASGNKKQIEESAILALELYKEQVVPWFESLTLEKIKKEINK